jgi:hypothetical protein
METQTENKVHTENQPDKQQPWNLNLQPSESSNATGATGRKWQLVSLAIGILLILTIGASGWMYVDKLSAAVQRDRVQDENQSLREQLNLAGAQITTYRNEIDALQKQTAVQVKEAPQAAASAAGTPTQPAAASAVTRKATYTKGTTRDEIISTMGTPDRIYKGRGYEQLVYFGKKPGRFWLVGDSVVQVGG